ncbi:unnamed protein product [Menidia menidia]|uniref:(Atlantic silverside) hypothetical protein n=1 Tax=Menidia menidia TaxID=238744 RepID=A0A8S4AYC1_9TELE|nr:unnamed protein product [Menidia menidia]
MNEEMTKSEEQHLSLQKALQQCELVQNMIDISISSLEGLRTKCATSNDLTQKEIRTLERSDKSGGHGSAAGCGGTCAFCRWRGEKGKLVKYFSRQLSCKCKVALEERSTELEDFPRLGHWFRIGLLEMSEEQVCELLQKFGANEEECARLNASLSCLRKAHQLEQLEEDKLHSNGGSQSKQDWSIQWPTSESGKENTPVCQPEASQWIRFQLSQSPKVQSKYNQHLCQSPQALGPVLYPDRLTVDSPVTGLFPSFECGHRSLPPSPRQRHIGHTPPRTPLVVNTMTPPGTPPMRRRNKVKAPGTPPPPSRKLIHLLPGFSALHRSKSHEAKKKTKPLNLKIHSSVGSCENLPTQRSPLHTERSLRSFFFPSFIPSTPPVHAETPSAKLDAVLGMKKRSFFSSDIIVV